MMRLLPFIRSSSQPTPDTFKKELKSTITIYSSWIWSIYSLIYYFEWKPPLNHSLKLLPIIYIPIGIGINWKNLRKTIAYYSTKDLLDIYDEKLKSNHNNQSVSKQIMIRKKDRILTLWGFLKKSYLHRLITINNNKQVE
ncbi:hypothetical protein PSHT_02483, partial [Puccinia striiformis]